MRRTLFLVIALLPVSSLAQQAIVTLRSTVTGNQEQPKVMYIVPWQPPGSMEFRYSPVSRLASDLFTQIDRDEFRRELDYRALLAEPDADGDGQGAEQGIHTPTQIQTQTQTQTQTKGNDRGIIWKPIT